MKSKDVGKRIARILKENRYSQQLFAKETGYTQSVISEILNGRRDCDRLVNIIAEKFGVSRDYLITGAEVTKNDVIVNNNIPSTGLTNEDRIRLADKLSSLYERHQNILQEAQDILKEVAAINRLLIVGTGI